MYTVDTEFQRFCDVNLCELIGAVGVYVIWDAHALARPSYIGEGNILKRLSDHVRRDGRKFAHQWDGYVAIISGSTRRVHKEETRAVECLLLQVARETDRMPAANDHPGSVFGVSLFCRSQTLRVAVSGYDPLLPPKEARPLTGAKLIMARLVRVNGKQAIEVEQHDWRFRRLRTR